MFCVSLRDAIAYAAWLSRETGHTYRLPSAAEWQYAARAGLKEAHLYIHSTDRAFRNSCGRASLDEDKDGKYQCVDGVTYTAEVGRFPPNGVGIHDMIGNVAEWALACLNVNADGKLRLAPDGAPESPDGCRYHLAMGGAFYHAGTPAEFASCLHGDYVLVNHPERTLNDGGDLHVGFRVARDLLDWEPGSWNLAASGASAVQEGESTGHEGFTEVSGGKAAGHRVHERHGRAQTNG